MVMYDAKEEQIKAILWTTFIPVSTQTGRRHEHSQEFMDFAGKVHNHEVDHKLGMKARIAQLKSQTLEK
jgi:acyl-CoA thioester hydrolase